MSKSLWYILQDSSLCIYSENWCFMLKGSYLDWPFTVGGLENQLYLQDYIRSIGLYSPLVKRQNIISGFHQSVLYTGISWLWICDRLSLKLPD